MRHFLNMERLVRTKTKKRTLYADISGENMDFIEKSMKKLNYSSKKGKAKFVDDLFTELRQNGQIKIEKRAACN